MPIPIVMMVAINDHFMLLVGFLWWESRLRRRLEVK